MYPQHRQLGLNLTQRQPQKKMIVLETVESVLGLVVPNMVMLKSGNVELRNLHPCPKNQHQKVVEGLQQMLKMLQKRRISIQH
jgi:hypothetical protein